MWILDPELLHQVAHQSPDYEATMETEDLIVTCAVAAGEMVLIQLGLVLALAYYPCLADRIVSFQERLEELVDAQLPEDAQDGLQ